MPLFSLSFLLGDIFLQLQKSLPIETVLLPATVIAISILTIRKRNAFLLLMICGLLLGFTWTAWRASISLSWDLPKQWEGKPVQISGHVASLPINGKFGLKFIFDVSNMKFNQASNNHRSLIRLTWKNQQMLKVGDKYLLTARLKRIHGLGNPGGFNYEAWALHKGIRASGSVIIKANQQYLAHDWLYAPIDQLRQYLQELIIMNLPNSETSPWLLALMIGDRSNTPNEHWRILRATGTNHLMAIAGLHIGLISGFVHLLVVFLWRRRPQLTLFYPAQTAGAISALIAAWIYSGLAGFSIPTQRACIMLTFFIGALLMRRTMPAWHAWSAALLIVLLINPLATVTASFWLSFGTIALIIYGMNGRLAPLGWWWKWGRVQWVIGIGLLPLSLYFFQQSSLISFIANSIAIPWLGLTILPFCLLSGIFLMIWQPLGLMFLWIADKSLAGLWVVLTWFARFDFSLWTQAIPSYFILSATIIACIALLLPAGSPTRWLGAIWLLPLFFYHAPQPENGDYWLTLLDVGQGLSVVIQTKQHTLVYDAGAKFSDKFDMGESVVLPFLYYSGIAKIDKLVISHGDNDHIGGSYAILQSMPVLSVNTSSVDKFPKTPASLCLAGDSWEWDKVKFSFLYPSLDALSMGNDSSCVLKIDNGLHSVLLTGDIEKFAEKRLLATTPDKLTSTIITAPHHGSKTSGLKRFIKTVGPDYVLFGTGYRNRYRFPHKSVVRSYKEEGAFMLNTVNSGAIQFKISHNKRYLRPMQYRVKNRYYWDAD